MKNTRLKRLLTFLIISVLSLTLISCGPDLLENDIDEINADVQLVYSNDGLIYYTSDHYESFDLLYGEENENQGRYT